MRKINIEFDGQSYLIVTKEGTTELGVTGSTTPESDETIHNIKIPNILIVTRKNADVLFVLKGESQDSFGIITAQELYDDYRYQWFEPLADNYREMIYLNKEDYINNAYKIFSWEDIVRFALVYRPLLSYRSEATGDWKSVSEGGDRFLLSLINGTPYWSDAIGQIPFAVGTYRTFHTIEATVKTGMTWATGKPWDALNQNSDTSNEYDNFFVLRGAIYASKKFFYTVKSTGKTYPSVDVLETSIEVDANILGKHITVEELNEYGIWEKT